MEQKSNAYSLHNCLDGSATLIDPFKAQSMHSSIGPMQEARQIYIAQSNLTHRLLEQPRRPVVVYDVGLGIAANALAAIEVALATGNQLALESFELHPEGLDYALNQIQNFSFIEPYQNQLRELLKRGATQLNDGRIQWNLHLGDFRTRINHAPPPELVFYDFYSPKVVPELWGLQCLGALATKMSQADPAIERRIITYTSKTSVRAALIYCGLHVGIGIGTAPKTIDERRQYQALAHWWAHRRRLDCTF